MLNWDNCGLVYLITRHLRSNGWEGARMKSTSTLLSTALVSAALAGIGLSFSGAPASAANQVKIDWYSVSPSFPDFNYPPCGAYDCGQYYTNANPEVAVGPLSGGRPVVAAGNPANLAEAVGAPLQWWTPQAGVTFEGSTVQKLPINQNMFVPMGTGDNDGSHFQTAIFSATLHVGAGGGTITYGGDDDMFLALNNSIVSQLGGIHPYGATVTYAVAPGTYVMDAFYADRHVVGAVADLQLGGNIRTGVPEPATWIMMLLGFASLGFAGYRKARPAPAVVIAP
jgi:hypothetical protein